MGTRSPGPGPVPPAGLPIAGVPVNRPSCGLRLALNPKRHLGPGPALPVTHGPSWSRSAPVNAASDLPEPLGRPGLDLEVNRWRQAARARGAAASVTIIGVACGGILGHETSRVRGDTGP